MNRKSFPQIKKKNTKKILFFHNVHKTKKRNPQCDKKLSTAKNRVCITFSGKEFSTIDLGKLVLIQSVSKDLYTN